MVHFKTMGTQRKQVAAMSALDIKIDRKVFEKADGGTHLAHKNLALNVKEGEFVAITGPSGCGKTTLLNIISGLDDDYEGAVSFSDEARDGLAYLFQTPRLLPWRTVLENLTLVYDDPSAGEAAARGLLADVELLDFTDSFPGQLSLGMQKRVSLARAFALSPKLLLMDEPFSSLDGDTAARLRSLLKVFLANQTVTTLLITHDHYEAVELADRILVLSPPPARVVSEIHVPLTQEERSDASKVEGVVTLIQ